MASIERELHELASIRSMDEPIVSLYLDARVWDLRRREILRLFVEEEIGKARERWASVYGEGFERTLYRVWRYARGIYRQAYAEDSDGVAIFACDAIGLWRVFRLPHRVRNKFSLGTTPNLLQLVRFAHGYQPALVVLVEAEGAWIFETELGDVASEARFAQEIFLRRATGEMAAPYHQRHIEQQIERGYARPAKKVTALLDRDPSLQLILSGPVRHVALFERVLPTRAKARILARLPAPGLQGDRDAEVRDRLVSEAVEKVRRNERQREQELIEGVVAKALGGGMAELGPQDVVLAANEGRIHRLLLERGLERSGARCTNCDALLWRPASACFYCGEEVEEVELAQELAVRVLSSGGSVEVMDPQPLLAHYAGVAAELRHRGSQPL